jgi:hypothetical protein
MRELKNSEIEAVSGGLKAVPVEKMSPFERLVAGVVAVIFARHFGIMLEVPAPLPRN